MTFIERFGQGLLSRAKTRRGSMFLVLTVLFAPSTVVQTGGPGASAANFLVSLPVIAGLVWFVARVWENRTWPGRPSFTRTREYSTQNRQLRPDANARLFVDRGGFLFDRRFFFIATGLPPIRLSAEFFRDVQLRSATTPAKVATSGVRTWWHFETGFWWENVGYEPDDVLALLKDRERRQKRELERAHMLMKAEASPRNVRGPISREMQRAIFERDGGVCVECGGNFSIQYDHIIPVAMGGATTIQNLQILCSYCNQAKGASI